MTNFLRDLPEIIPVGVFQTMMDDLANHLDELNTTDVTNLSNLNGATVTEALNGLDTSDIANLSNVNGATTTDALNELLSSANSLTSSDISNSSNVSGATSTDALNNLLQDVSDIQSDVSDILATELVSGSDVADLNSIDISRGIFFGVVTSSTSNAPISWGFVLHIQRAGNRRGQLVLSLPAGTGTATDIYYRIYNDNQWQAWEQVHPPVTE